jgi:hypothetical protein
VEVGERNEAVHAPVDGTVHRPVRLARAVVEEDGVDVGGADAEDGEERRHADVEELVAQALARAVTTRRRGRIR